jgi:hypothetical protein
MTDMTTDSALSAALGTATAGRLVFTRGVLNLRLVADSSMQELYRARIGGRMPDITVHDGAVEVTYRHSLSNIGLGRSSIDLTLNATIPWQIWIRRGAASLSADLRRLRLTGLQVDGGVSRAELTLADPDGAVPVHVSGGASQLSIHRPKTAAVQLEVQGGTSKLTFDDSQWGAMGGPIRLHSPGYDGSGDHYAVGVGGGASRIVLDTY